MVTADDISWTHHRSAIFNHIFGVDGCRFFLGYIHQQRVSAQGSMKRVAAV